MTELQPHGGSTDPQHGFVPFNVVDPLNLRPLLFLEVTRDMMLASDWAYRAVTIVMESHLGPGRFAFYGANHVDSLRQVHERTIDVSTLNPSVMLTMAYRGVGPFTTAHDVAIIAVLPHEDQLGFAVRNDLGFRSLEDIAAVRYPLKVSTRGSHDINTSIMIDVVLRAHGFSLDELQSWGGRVLYDQVMPTHSSRMGRLANGEIDAIFDEAVPFWADLLPDAGAGLLSLNAKPLEYLETLGYRPVRIQKARHSWLSEDVASVDYGGWPIYCRTDTSDVLVEKFCRALISRREQILWEIGTEVQQPPLPLESMVKDAPATPMDVPLHARAAAIWREQGWI